VTEGLPRSAAVLGLGLIGGSLARDLAARGVRVLGYDRDPYALDGAQSSGIEPLRSLSGERLADAELVVLALPVTASAELLPRLVGSLADDCVLTDVGSTKRSIAEAAERSGMAERFVGSHPMAGDHRSGWGATREGLFDGARVFVCPTDRSSRAALTAVTRLWSELGAVLEEISVDAHDRLLAWTSHLPQLLSSSFGSVLAAHGYSRDQLGPGGRDMTRLAASSPEMWSAICLDNHDEIRAALGALKEHVTELHDAVDRRDADALHAFLAAARDWAVSTLHAQ
jgi:prephenate dehydrogenase